MKPSRALKLYYSITFVLGLLLTVPLAHWVRTDDVGMRGAAIMILSLNVLFIMIMPLVIDWAESRYFKARFLALEEVAKDNPELANMLESQCQKLALPGLKLAVVDDGSEVFSYGLWRNNPRLIMSATHLQKTAEKDIAPSVEAELTRFANQDHTLMFLLFAAFQVMVQNLLVYLMGLPHLPFLH
ncbi:MAG: hypothetical protein LCH63_00085 [Candidatus Melainabacteria bacterium]|jgi:Zn-dependent protease with chaperone function|uniref:Peptidase M48 domain-containing protein n=1 Tax=Candidatus Obscuribacter phosphatis TaxID=1906157 RepID=A0A8J7PM62_9BACT|nr:hypothetical protein [Candidatus Obscuribacter phosphatis]MCA0312216.1 hypothetical protein [Candidatus Melainabacteria bacterium]OPZ88958.1 MAG: Protease HtpX [bacterium ADurb.Bin425]